MMWAIGATGDAKYPLVVIYERRQSQWYSLYEYLREKILPVPPKYLGHITIKTPVHTMSVTRIADINTTSTQFGAQYCDL